MPKRHTSRMPSRNQMKEIKNQRRINQRRINQRRINQRRINHQTNKNL